MYYMYMYISVQGLTIIVMHKINVIIFIATPRYSQGSGTIWLDNLQCTSSDSMLSSCSHNGFGNEDCNHSDDAAVSCSTSGTGKFFTLISILIRVSYL